MSCFARIATLGVAVSGILLCCSGYESVRADPVGSAQKANGPTCDRSAFRLILDVGHTPKAFGATSARGQREFDFNLRLAKVI
jgi:N-acetylmuramoyl-L-alanine amidase